MNQEAGDLSDAERAVFEAAVQSVQDGGVALSTRRDRYGRYLAPYLNAALKLWQMARQAQGLAVSQEPKYTVDGSSILNRSSGVAIPADEPVFVFRARDVLAIDALKTYEAQVALRADSDHLAAVRNRIEDFARFAETHPDLMKVPDSPTASTAP